MKAEPPQQSFAPDRLEAELLRVHRHAWARLLLRASLAANAVAQECAWYPPSCREPDEEALRNEVRAALRLAQADGLRPPAALQAWLCESLAPQPLIEAAESLLPGIGTLVCRGLAAWPALASGWAEEFVRRTTAGEARQWHPQLLEAQALLCAREGAHRRAFDRFEQLALHLPVSARLQALALAIDCGMQAEIESWAARLDGSREEALALSRLQGALRRRRRVPRAAAEACHRPLPKAARALALALG